MQSYAWESEKISLILWGKNIPHANLVEFRILEGKHVNVYFLLFLGQNYKAIKTFYFAKK